MECTCVRDLGYLSLFFPMGCPSTKALSPWISIEMYPTCLPSLPNHPNHATDKRPTGRRNWGLHYYGIDAKACTGTKKFLSIDTRYPAPPGHGRHPRVTLYRIGGSSNRFRTCVQYSFPRLASACPPTRLPKHVQTRAVDLCSGCCKFSELPRLRVPTVLSLSPPVRHDQIPTGPNLY